LVIKTLDPDWIRIRIQIGIQPKMLDLDPESVNSDQKDFFQYIFVKKCLNIIVNCVKKEESVVDSELEPKAQFRVYRYRYRAPYGAPRNGSGSTSLHGTTGQDGWQMSGLFAVPG
jgi:hypothetical protein